MTDYSAGTASVRITPDARAFLKDLEAKLRTMKDPRFTVSVDADTTRANAAIDKLRAEQRERHVYLGVDVALAQAKADMTAFRQGQERDGITVKVDADTGKARAELASLQRQTNGFGSLGDALKLNVGALGIGAIQPAIAGVAQLAAGLQQLAQSGIAVPGVIAGAAASIGTLVLGLSGISDAYKAVSEASTSSGADQTAAARAGVSASNNLRNAVQDEAQARKDVAQATRDSATELRDLSIQQRGGMLDESRAILSLQQARERLASGKYTDVRDALLDVSEAVQRVDEVRARNADTQTKLNDAQVKGIAGSDQVVAANERLIRSGQQVSEAQAAVADSGSKMSAAQKKADEAMKSLSPNAQALVKTLVDMKPAFNDARSAISEPLLAGKAEEFKTFFTTMKPIVERGGAQIAEGWNKNITALFGAVSSQEGQGLIDRILGNTGDAQGKLSAAIDPLVKGLGTLTAAGSDSLPRMADGLAAVSQRFSNFITQADQDGRLDKWINEGLDGLTHFGNAVLNVGKTFTAITQASGGAGTFLRWLEDATGRLQTFLNSAEGQNKLRDYFSDGKRMLSEFVPLLKELPGALKAIGDGAATYIGAGLLPVLKTVAELIGDHPELVKTAIAAYLGFKTVSPIVGGVMNVLSKFNDGVIGVGTNFAGTREKIDKETGRINNAFNDASKVNSPLRKFSANIGALGAVGGPIGILAATAIPGLIAVLGDLDKKNQESAQVTKDLEQAQKDLELTVDRVTGKLTGQSRSALISGAQNFDATGRPGGGIPGISKGDALDAAVKLGIPPDLYVDALQGKPGAKQKVTDVLLNNNLRPEFQANERLGALSKQIGVRTGGEISQDDLLKALIGDPEAVKRYTDVIERNRQAAGTHGGEFDQFSLDKIAQQLSPTGQASVLSGGNLNFTNQALPGLGDPTRQANQALNGRFRTTAALPGVPVGTAVYSTGGQGYKLALPPNVNPFAPGGMIAFEGLDPQPNPDGTYTITIPQDSPMIEKYRQGSQGLTPGAPNRGFLAELHGQEWVHDAGTVSMYGPEVMEAMWKHRIDPKALRGLVPGFLPGGPTDPNDPNYVGIASGQAPGGSAPGPVAPNPYDGGGISDILNSAVAGAQSPMDTFTNSLFGGIGIPGYGKDGQSGGGGLFGNGASLFGQAPDGRTTIGGRAIGLDPKILANDPLAVSGAKTYLANWAGKTLASAGNILYTGALSSLGLQDSVLSPNNQWTQDALKVAGHFSGAQGQGGSNGLTNDQLAALYANGGLPNPAYIDPTTGLALPVGSGGSGKGLQINTARGEQIIQQMFPWAKDIGGYSVRPPGTPQWHTKGLALDVMIPGGDTSGGANPQGLAQGNQMYAWLMAHKQELGIDYIMWQEKDHFNHLHVNFAASGYANGAAPAVLQGPAAGAPMPTLLPPPAPPIPNNGAPGQTTPLPPGMDPSADVAHGGPTTQQLRDAGLLPPAPAPPPRPPRATAPIPPYGPFAPATNPVDNPLLLPQYNRDSGGFLPSGTSIVHNATGGVEYVLNRPQAMAAANALRVPGFLAGGPATPWEQAQQILPTPPPRPDFQVPDITPMQPAPAAPPAPVAAPVPPTPPAGPAVPPPDMNPPPVLPVAAGGGSGGGPAGTNHTLPWINKAIESGAAVGANIASSAIGALGGGGGIGLPGAGAIGQFVGGAIKQGGKIVEGVANVVSSAFVGSVPGSFGSTPEAYGRTQRPAQRQLATAPSRSASYGPFFGHDADSVMQMISLHESIEQQSAFASHPGRI